MLDATACSPPFHLTPLPEFVPTHRLHTAEGDVVLLRVRCAAPGTAGGVAAAVAGIRRAHPGCPLAVWIPNAPLQTAIEVVRAASTAQVRAILGGPVPDAALLREQLTHPLELSGFVLRWAVDAGYIPAGVEHHDVRELIDAAPDVRTLKRLAVRRQVAARTWRSHLQQLGLPTPRAWLGLAHALHVAFYVQRNASLPIHAVCQQLGSHTVTHMGQQFRRLFGLSPGQVRGLLGAEPLLHRWFQARARR